ncbi:hypothetical protein [Pseudomonas sp. SLFW]|uniref:hypothetical protein n=1 Tax=Pseudomonas sp. SLFW TaxID=2683259 RepID=UPI00141255CF|nr:hypothetical protein [Pseudomonas sp. SLFW]NBB08037.1 hypothetical protein [Pseudomonas sp. SLFW]
MGVNFILNWSMAFGMLLLIVDAALLLWVVLFRVEQIEDALGNSKINVEAKRLGSNTGLLGRQYRLGLATSVMLFSNMYIRKGLVDPDDVKNMPIHLKRWAVIPHVAAAVLLLLLFFLALMTGKI